MRDYLLSIQEFNGETWLRQLADLTNFNKHRSLSAQNLAEFHSVIVGFDEAAIRFGELGLRSLDIESGGILRFVNSSGQQADMNGPRVIDADTSPLLGVDLRIKALQESHVLYCIPGHSESIASTIWRINRNVFRAIDKICALLS